MAQITFAALASDDIDGLLLDLAAKAGHQVARRYDGLFERLYARLAEHPDSGSPRPALGENIRIGVVAPFVVVYQHRQATNTVLVLRVLDARRRITGLSLIRARRQ